MQFPTIVVNGDILSSWLSVSGCSRTQLAAKVGVSKGRISQLLTSKEKPSAALMARLMLVTQLPFNRLFKIIHEPVPHMAQGHGSRGVQKAQTLPAVKRVRLGSATAVYSHKS